MDGSGVVKLFPPGTRLLRCFIAPGCACAGAAEPPGWDDVGMRLCKQRSKGRATVGNGVFLKEYVYRARFECWRRRFMTPRPFTVLAAALRLETLKVPTPRVLAAARGVSSDGAIRDLLITEELPADVCFGDAAALSVEVLAHELVPVMSRLHDGGFYHGDLSLRNWYRCADGTWGLIDLDGAELSRWRVPKMRRTRELARLASSCFLTTPQPGAERGALFALGRRFLEVYTAAGGSVYERHFLRRTLALVNRSRRKYLQLEAI